MRFAISLFVICLAASASPAIARVALNPHITEPGYGVCGSYDYLDEIDCRELASDPYSGVAFVWVLASWYQGELTGMSEVSFGVNHTMPVTSFVECSGAEVDAEPGWPESGTGARFTWDPCYLPLGCTARVGLYVVSDGYAGSINIVEDPRVGVASFTNCDGHTLMLEPTWELGEAVLENGTHAVCGHLADGYCSITTDVPVESMSWSRIRTLF